MKILKMTASFGSLQKKELVLKDGLNVFCLPNEAGKSTWSAFLLCMFYGIDTAERASKTNLPFKKRYKPWWGGNMEGYMELSCGGRRIAIERTSTARAPMSQFRAWDLDSGEPLDELTGDNCGEKLLGVERSVFLRSAFLGQRALGVSPDAALERRLSALVTSGDESVSAAETQKRLKDAKNRIQHNKTGLLPQAEAGLLEIEQTLREIRAIHTQDDDARAQMQSLSKQQAELSTLLDGWEQYQAAKRFEKKREAEEKLRACEDELAKCALEAAQYPKRGTLQMLRQEMQALSQEACAPDEQEAPIPPLPEKPTCPPAFAGLVLDEILPQAERDAKRHAELTAGKVQPARLHFALAAGLFALALASILLLHKTLAGAAFIFCAAVFAVLGWRGAQKNRARAEKLSQAEKICEAYERNLPERFVVLAAQYREELLSYERAMQARESAQKELAAIHAARAEQRAALAARRGKLLGMLAAFCPEVTDEESFAAALSRAEAALAREEEAKHRAEHAKAALEAITAALGDEAQQPLPPGDWESFDDVRARQALSACEQTLTKLRSQLDQSRGRMQALGESAELEAQREALCARIETLREKDAALALAQQALLDASEQLQTRFAPKLTTQAGEIFSRLTGARYDRVSLDRQMNLSAGEQGEVALRQTMALSGGTVDQLYLALRLAICEQALPEATPIVLDDALAMFDDARAARALEVLQALSRKRQILLFSCHSREAAMLSQLQVAGQEG